MSQKANIPKEAQKKIPKTTKEPPLEGSSTEYTSLLQIATSLTPSEAKSELIESARYGELDCVKALLQTWSSTDSITNTNTNTNINTPIPDYINTTDSNGTGNTALHKASASGHDSVVQLLLNKGAKHLPNTNKNTPLHWAAANGHENIVEMILEHDFISFAQQHDAVDVLRKNQGGRSALTEGFTSQKTKMVGLLLEHDSAAEEKLLMGTNAKEVDDDGNDVDVDVNMEDKDDNGGDKNGDYAKHGITHEFDFLRDGNEDAQMEMDDTEENENGNGNEAPNSIWSDSETNNPDSQVKTLLIRELPIQDADNPFDEGDEKLDTTGLGIWSASLVMACWMASKATLGRFDDKFVLELGAGCGVPGLALGMYSDASSTVTMQLGIERVLKENFDNIGEVAQVELEMLEGGEGGDPDELTMEAVMKEVNRIAPAITAMGGNMEVLSVDPVGVVEVRFRGANKVQQGVELALLDVKYVKHVKFVN